jgi:hypothetical protein
MVLLYWRIIKEILWASRVFYDEHFLRKNIYEIIFYLNKKLVLLVSAKMAEITHLPLLTPAWLRIYPMWGKNVKYSSPKNVCWRSEFRTKMFEIVSHNREDLDASIRKKIFTNGQIKRLKTCFFWLRQKWLRLRIYPCLLQHDYAFTPCGVNA